LGFYFISFSPSSQENSAFSVLCDKSSHWHHWFNVEWSVDVETKFFIESLGSESISILKIDNLPFLVDSSIVWAYVTFLHFSILCIQNFKYLLGSWIDELFTSVLE
jgi:hypothetical protein